jgi:outer membrane protein assembly factor BamB
VIYVTAGDGAGTTLYAIEQASGATLWSHTLGGSYGWSGLTYDAGQVFTVDYNGTMTAFDAETGLTDWSITLPGQYSFSSPPTAYNGNCLRRGRWQWGYRLRRLGGHWRGALDTIRGERRPQLAGG